MEEPKTALERTGDAVGVSEIDELRERMIALERLASVGELSSTVTHEFNNILMMILNYAQLGLRHQDVATRDKAFQKILDGAQRAGKICGTVLALAKGGDESGVCDVRGTVTDTLVLLEREMQKYRIHVELQLEDVPAAAISPPGLQRALINLMTNARQAIKERGTIMIRLQPDPTRKFILLSIRDSGGGIPADVLPRIFDRFFTTKSGPDESGKGGTGLGLATVRELVESAGGRVRVESAVGKGTAFTLRLPAAPAKPEASARAPAPAKPTAPAKTTAPTRQRRTA